MLSSRNNLAASILLAIGIGCAITYSYWLPWARYFAYQGGFTTDMKVDDVTIQMKKGWFVILSSREGLGQFLVSSDTADITLGKVTWPKLGQDGLVIIKKISRDDAERYRTVGRTIVEVKDYQWGKASIVMGELDAVVSDYAIRISVLDTSPPKALFDVLNDIQSLKKENGATH